MNRMTPEGKAKLEELIARVMKDGQARGIAVGIVNAAGEIQYENYFGYRDAENKLPITRDTIFGMASVTKSFTALSIMQMQQDGLLKVDDPDAELIYREDFAEEGIRRVAGRLDSQTRFTGRPGQRMSYCNDGFGLLSDIVRRHSGYGSFAEYLDKKILKPIGMDRSNISFIRNSQDENAAILYSLENGTWRADRDYQNDAFVLHGGGGMKSTLGDMLKYAVMYLNEGVAGNGNRIVERYAVQEMEKPRQFMKPGIYYGYGLETKQVGDRAVYEHGGSLPGVSSNFSFCPQEEVGIVVLCNTMDVSVAAIADAALNAYCGLEVEEERQIHAERSWSAEELEELAGSYVSGEGDAFTLTVENGTLSMKVNGNPTALQAVYPWQGMVRKTYSDIYLTAIRDEEGHVFAARYGSRIFPKEV